NAKTSHFEPAKRSAVFRYALFGNSFAAPVSKTCSALPCASGSSGIARDNPGTDFLVTLGRAKVPGGTESWQAGTFMHELGHTLGLKHGGIDEVNFKPNYLSIM